MYDRKLRPIIQKRSARVQSVSGACYAPTAVERRCALGSGEDGCRSNRASARECARAHSFLCFGFKIMSKKESKEFVKNRCCQIGKIRVQFNHIVTFFLQLFVHLKSFAESYLESYPRCFEMRFCAKFMRRSCEYFAEE